MKNALIGLAVLAVLGTTGLFIFRTGGKDCTLVTRVIDGDTIEVSGGERIRYIGVDTPELGDKPQCFGAEAAEENRALVQGACVRLVADAQDRDDYGRLLRYVYVASEDSGHAGEVFVNLELVWRGFARAIFIEPNTAHYGEFKSAQDAARSVGMGRWSACR